MIHSIISISLKVKDNYLALISIIVPVYNSEQYLDNCITSILDQTYSNIELIIIDDGSTDQSYQICNNYSSQDNRIVLLKQSHKGASAARNLGITTANGTWLTFVDSDDQITNNFIEDFTKNQLTAECLLAQGVTVIHENGSTSTLTSRETIGYNCSKLFSKEIIIRNNIYYNTKMNRSEDEDFVFRYVFHIKKIIEINENGYFIKQRSDSISNNTSTSYYLNAISFYLHYSQLDYIKEFPTISSYISNNIRYTYHYFLQHLYNNHSQKERIRLLKIVFHPKENINYYPIIYRSDPVVRFLLSIKAFHIADLTNSYLKKYK